MAPRNNAGPGPKDPVGRVIGARATGTSGKSVAAGLLAATGLAGIAGLIHRYFNCHAENSVIFRHIQ
jgi:hypothetical protein